MLGRANRFHGYGILKRIYSNSSIARGSLVSLRYSKNKPDRKYRVAVVVGKKVNKSAVQRNKIRRRIYEIVRQSENIENGKDYVFTVYSDKILDLPHNELVNQIDDLSKKAK
jgi:ribonuclease P protein component